MIPHLTTATAIHDRSITVLASAWREFAQLGGDLTDPSVQLLGVPTSHGFQPGFFTPATGHLVVIHTAAPYPDETSAMTTLWLLAMKVHQKGLSDLGGTQ